MASVGMRLDGVISAPYIFDIFLELVGGDNWGCTKIGCKFEGRRGTGKVTIFEDGVSVIVKEDLDEKPFKQARFIIFGMVDNEHSHMLTRKHTKIIQFRFHRV